MNKHEEAIANRLEWYENLLTKKYIGIEEYREFTSCGICASIDGNSICKKCLISTENRGGCLNGSRNRVKWMMFSVNSNHRQCVATVLTEDRRSIIQEHYDDLIKRLNNNGYEYK
jgi:hypothetical protein